MSAAVFLPVATLAPSAALASAGPMNLSTFFSGHLVATGDVKNYTDGKTRTVKVDIRGKPSGKLFEIRMNTLYSDGKREIKTWTFQSLGAGRFIGRRADLVGTAAVTATGSRINMSYVAKVEVQKGKSYNVAFTETYQFSSPGKGTNTVRASMLAIPVGEGHLVITKMPN